MRKKWQSNWVEIKQISKGEQINKIIWRQGRIKHRQGKWNERMMELLSKKSAPTKDVVSTFNMTKIPDCSLIDYYTWNLEIRDRC
jgi:hypothetical protein